MVNRSGSTKRRLNETQHREFKTHEMGMQISRGIHPEVSQEKYLWVGETGTRADHSGFSPAERERSGGGAPDGRPCSHAVVDTTEVLGLRGGGVYQGQECHCDRYVSTVGRDEAQIREYIREQEKEDKRLDQLKIFE